MRIEFVTRGTLNEYAERIGASCADVLMFSFQGIDEIVSYERELKGETSYFEDVAILSRESQNVVVSGCITDTRGILRKSAVIAENGKILGVSDMLNVVDGEYNCGAMSRVYETKIGRIGIVVADDLYFPDVAKSLSVCGSDYLLCPMTGSVHGIEKKLICASSFFFGVPSCLCAEGYAFCSGIDGESVFASPKSPVETDISKGKEYHLVESRHKGFYKKSFDNY